MCGIFGIAFRRSARAVMVRELIDGLRALEYRGYDSAGMAIQFGRDNSVRVVKCSGRVQALADLIAQQQDICEETESDNGVCMAHTRWATHGLPTDINAHPHTSNCGSFAVVHNGIITNHTDLRCFLVDTGYVFTSDTDTEVIVALCEYIHRENVSQGETKFNFARLVYQVTQKLEGAYAILAMSSLAPCELVATRRGSPLIIGFPSQCNEVVATTDGHYFPTVCLTSCSTDARDSGASSKQTSQIQNDYYFSSDTAALAPHVDRVLYLEDGTIAHACAGRLVLYEKEQKNIPVCVLDMRFEEICKHGYRDFMLKEIMEQPNTIRQTLAGRLQADGTLCLHELQDHWRFMNKARRLLFFGCGTSYNAALVMQPLFERLSTRPVQIELASDFLDRRPPIYRDDVCIFISQSGETADTLEALRYCRKEGDALCVGIVNTVGSTIARSTDCGLYLNCGKEIGVASTKAYTSQLIALMLLASHYGFAQNEVRKDDACAICRALLVLSEQLQRTLLSCSETSARIAQRLNDERCHSMLLIGRAQQFATCREGALKIKEIAYVYTEAIAAGELKHGSVALVDANAHMLVVATHDDTENKVRNAMSQLMARAGRPFLLTDNSKIAKDDDIVKKCRDIIIVPRAAHPALQCIINILPLQLIAYNLALLRGYDVDKPRNLAKSVTVE